MKKAYPLFLLALISTFCLPAQNDSTLQLQPERLTFKDIIARKTVSRPNTLVAATRSAEAADELPFNVWVITSEDILLNGFVTLGDVLRAAPGIRVSQPGNAYEGETFLMRGLSGNQYVKILLNGVPIKPSGAVGMPIGAQLPIRQAERIEIYYGPAAAIFGNDAAAGVVNIVLKETERPIFTQADLSFGNMDYNSLDLMFGGKLGKDKRVLRFSLYGSSLVRNNADVLYDKDLLNLNQYLPLGLDTSIYLRYENFRPAANGADSFPNTIPIAHESRLFGIDLAWQGVRFNYQRMQRSEFSGLGLNPLAISYSNPSNKISDQLDTYSLAYTLHKKRVEFENNLSVVRYFVNPNSSASYIFDQLSTSVFEASKVNPQDPNAKAIVSDIYDRYSSRERYFIASSLDAHLESILHARLNDGFFTDFGVQANLYIGTPLLGHFETPQSSGTGSGPGATQRPYDSDQLIAPDAALWSQIGWIGRKWRIQGGTSLNFDNQGNTIVAPRGALMYKIDSSWSIYGNYSTGFRRPTLYNQAQLFSIDRNLQATPFGQTSANAPESVYALEGGLRFSKNNSLFELSSFGQNVYNLVRPGFYTANPQVADADLYGYQASSGLSMRVWGLQGRLVLDSEKIPLSLDRFDKGFFRWRHEFYAQYARGKEWFGYGIPDANDVRNLPHWTTQYRSTIQTRKLHLVFASNRQTSVLSKAVSYSPVFQRTPIETRYPTYRRWDFMARFYLSDHFLIYCQVDNIFNRHFAGLDATGTIDDLLYNPQFGRSVRFGVNYNMN